MTEEELQEARALAQAALSTGLGRVDDRTRSYELMERSLDEISDLRSRLVELEKCGAGEETP